MATKYFALLTERGAAKLAAATALGTQVKLTQMAVGDGGGSLPVPTATQTALIGEKRRAALNSLTVDPANASQIIAEQVIPESEGGFWIREIGVFDDAGELIAIANCAETYKPVLAEGSGRTQVIRMVLIVSSTDAVTLKIDPSVVLATRKYVDDQTIIVKAYADDLMAKHLAAADPHTQYAPKASPTLTGTPKAPTAAASNNSTQIATTAFVQAVIAQLVASSPATLDTLNELAAALGNDPNFATTMTNALAQKAPLASPGLTGTPTAPTAAATENTTQIATTAFVQAVITALKAGAPAALDTLDELAAAINDDPNFATTISDALALKAPLASPAMTGTPTAPTAASTANNTQLATTAFVKTAIANLVASAPGALDTLKELADALGNDANFAATMTNALALKAPLASPALTGTPTAPTAAVGTNTAQLATTAFVASTLSYLGYGTAPATRAALDWQNDTFDIGQAFAVNGANITNIPAGMDSPGTLNVNINVRSGDGSTTRIIDVVYSTVTAAGYRKYEVRLAGNVGSRNILARQVFTSADTLPLASGGTGDKTAEGAIQNLLVRENLTGIVGATVNAKMTIATASATGTFTADEIIVADSLAGRQFRLTAFSKTVNLAATGANGMDTGTAPTSGFVALYAIYNPTTATPALLAVNATATAVAEIYGGANMPSGYTASALLCVVPTDSTGKIAPLLQMGRKTLIATAQLSSTTAFISTPTALNISAAVPKNAKFLDGILYLVSGNSTRPVISVQPLSSPAVGIKQVVGGNSTGVNNTQAPFSDLAISTAQTIYWQVSAGVAGDTISSAFTYATGYSI